MKRNVSIQQCCNKIWSCLKSQLFTRNSRASAAIYAVLVPALQSGLWIATLLLIDFAPLLQNIYKFAKIARLFKVKYCLADFQTIKEIEAVE